MKRTIQAGVFKAQCLEFIRNKDTIIITKRNEPVAELKPIEKKIKPIVGRMKGTIHIKGDLIEPIGEDWNACL